MMSLLSFIKRLGIIMLTLGLLISLSLSFGGKNPGGKLGLPRLNSERHQEDLKSGEQDEGKPNFPTDTTKSSGTLPTENNENDALPATAEEWGEKFAEESAGAAEGRFNVLLLGVDARGNEPSRSDSIILVSLNSTDYSAELISVMRDTYVTIPVRKPTKNRINTAIGMGGPALAVKTVSRFLGVPIENYVVVDFQGFEKAVDAIGGIELEVEKKMDYVDDGKNDIHLQAGRQTLNGKQALGYARFRHDAMGDYARVERQRRVLKGIVDKIQGVQAVYYLPRLLESVKPYIKTNLNLSALASLAYYAYCLKGVESHTVPSVTAHTATVLDGMAVLLPNLDKTQQEVKQYLK